MRSVLRHTTLLCPVGSGAHQCEIDDPTITSLDVQYSKGTTTEMVAGCVGQYSSRENQIITEYDLHFLF